MLAFGICRNRVGLYCIVLYVFLFDAYSSSLLFQGAVQVSPLICMTVHKGIYYLLDIMLLYLYLLLS